MNVWSACTCACACACVCVCLSVSLWFIRLFFCDQKAFNATTIAGPTWFDPSTGLLQRPTYCFQFNREGTSIKPIYLGSLPDVVPIVYPAPQVPYAKGFFTKCKLIFSDKTLSSVLTRQKSAKPQTPFMHIWKHKQMFHVKVIYTWICTRTRYAHARTHMHTHTCAYVYMPAH